MYEVELIYNTHHIVLDITELLGKLPPEIVHLHLKEYCRTAFALSVIVPDIERIQSKLYEVFAGDYIKEQIFLVSIENLTINNEDIRIIEKEKKL